MPVIKEPKDALVKIEEGAEGSKGPSAERAGKFFVGADVAYRLAKQKEDPQWIQCTILSITEVGNKKRQISLVLCVQDVLLTYKVAMRFRTPSLMITERPGKSTKLWLLL